MKPEAQKESDSFLKDLQEYVGIWLENYGHQNWSVEEYLKMDAGLFLEMDKYFDFLEIDILQRIENEKESKGFERCLHEMLVMVDSIRSAYAGKSVNPYTKEYSSANYALKKLSIIREKLNVMEGMAQLRAKSKKAKKRLKTFPEYLLHAQSEALARNLKTSFKTETGKTIRLLIKALEEWDPPLITVENRQRTAIHNAMQEYFDQNIGTRNSVFDFKFHALNDGPDLEAIKTRLVFLLESINT